MPIFFVGGGGGGGVLISIVASILISFLVNSHDVYSSSFSAPRRGSSSSSTGQRASPARTSSHLSSPLGVKFSSVLAYNWGMNDTTPRPTPPPASTPTSTAQAAAPKPTPTVLQSPALEFLNETALVHLAYSERSFEFFLTVVDPHLTRAPLQLNGRHTTEARIRRFVRNAKPFLFSELLPSNLQPDISNLVDWSLVYDLPIRGEISKHAFSADGSILAAVVTEASDSTDPTLSDFDLNHVLKVFRFAPLSALYSNAVAPLRLSKVPIAKVDIELPGHADITALSVSAKLVAYSRAHDTRCVFRSILLESSQWSSALLSDERAPDTIEWQHGPSGPLSAMLRKPRINSNSFFEVNHTDGDEQRSIIHTFSSIKTVHLTVLPSIADSHARVVVVEHASDRRSYFMHSHQYSLRAPVTAANVDSDAADWHWSAPQARFRKNLPLRSRNDLRASSPPSSPSVAVASGSVPSFALSAGADVTTAAGSADVSVLCVYPFISSSHNGRNAGALEVLNLPENAAGFSSTLLNSDGSVLALADLNDDWLVLRMKPRRKAAADDDDDEDAWAITLDLKAPRMLSGRQMLSARLVDVDVKYKVTQPAKKPVQQPRRSPLAPTTHKFGNVHVSFGFFSPLSLFNLFDTLAAEPEPEANTQTPPPPPITTEVTKRLNFLVAVHTGGRLIAYDITPTARPRVSFALAPLHLTQRDGGAWSALRRGSAGLISGLSRRERNAAAEADKWTPTEADEVAHYGRPDSDSQDAVGSHAGADDEFELLSDWFTDLLLMIDSAGLEFEILVAFGIVGIYLIVLGVTRLQQARQRAANLMPIFDDPPVVPAPPQPAAQPAPQPVPEPAPRAESQAPAQPSDVSASDALPSESIVGDSQPRRAPPPLRDESDSDSADEQ